MTTIKKTVKSSKLFKLNYMKKSIATNVIFIPLCFLWCYPFLWMVSNAFKTPPEMFLKGLRIIPEKPVLYNFVRAWKAARFEQYLLNSVIITCGVVILVLIVASMAGYAFAKQNLAGKKLLLAVLLATMFFPKSVGIIPIYKIINALGLNNTYLGVILAIGGPAHVMAILLFMRYFMSVPKELEESVRIDGGGYLTVFIRIMLPLAKPVFATVGIFNFISAWNDFMVPLIFTLNKPSMRTIGVGLYAFFGEGTADWTGLCAAATIAIIPIITVFLAFQRFFIEGLEGSVKG